MSDKKRYSYGEAHTVAESIMEMLYSRCEQIKIAGSLRRQKQEVGDIELLFIPYMVPVKDDLFGGAKMDDAAADAINGMVDWGYIKKRPNSAGHFTWGPQNKLAVHVESGIPIDFFATTKDRWFVSLVIRTGPKELNIRLITEAAKRGYKLHAYGVLEKVATGEQIAPASEQELFEYCGVPYVEPKDRR